MKKPIVADETGGDESPAVHNKDVERALKEYCHFPLAQGFAVMLSGKWGSGKTHFITSILDDLVSPKKDASKHKPLYVSLYGVKDPSEIGDQLFQQLHPILGHKATRLFGAILRSAAKATIKLDIAHAAQLTGALPDLDLSSMLGGSEGRVIIFDDFERAAMSPVAILGYINPLVEHDDCKVLILADEDQVTEQDEYKKRKEKTVGRTFEFKADFGAAFSAFMESIDDSDVRVFFTAYKEELLKVFADSGLNNLRLLKQFLWDFERLWKTLTQEQRQHKDAMRELVSLLCASAIELRSGGLTVENFRRDDVSHHIALRVETPEDATKVAQKVFKKYPTVRFDSTLLEADTIVDFILKSKLPIGRIQQQLRQHPYFAQIGEIPSWRALWLSSEIPAQEHDDIVKRFEADFVARKFHVDGEIKHIIGVSLWLSEMGFPGWEEPGTVEKIKQYIVDVYSRGEAGPDEMRESTLDYISGGAFGLGYMNADDPRFAELAQYQNQQRAGWRQRAYPTIAAQLHKLMTDDSKAFLRDICFTNGGKARFARLGVLKQIPADQFAATIVNAPYRDQNEVMMALSIRYEQVADEPELEAEIQWLRDVQQHLRRLGEALPQIAQFHLFRLTKEYLDKRLSKIDAWLLRKNPS